MVSSSSRSHYRATLPTEYAVFLGYFNKQSAARRVRPATKQTFSTPTRDTDARRDTSEKWEIQKENHTTTHLTTNERMNFYYMWGWRRGGGRTEEEEEVRRLENRKSSCASAVFSTLRKLDFIHPFTITILSSHTHTCHTERHLSYFDRVNILNTMHLLRFVYVHSV